MNGLDPITIKLLKALVDGVPEHDDISDARWNRMLHCLGGWHGPF